MTRNRLVRSVPALQITRNRYMLLADLPIIAIAAFGAFALRFDWLFFRSRPEFVSFLLLALLIKPVVFFTFGMYRRFWPYASVADVVAVGFGVSFASVAVAVGVSAGLLTGWFSQFSRAVLLIDWLLTLLAVGGLRMSARLLSEAFGAYVPSTDTAAKRVIIVGAGRAGVMALREIQRNHQLGMTVVGLLDDDRAKVGKSLHGVPVLGPVQALQSAARRHDVQEVIIAIPTAPGHVLRKIAEGAREAGISSRTMPGVFELLGGRVSVSRLRQLDITDLLRREPILGDASASLYLAGQTVLVTGGGGSVGFELCRQVAAANPKQLVILGHGENSLFEAQQQLRDTYKALPIEVAIADVRDRARLATLFRHFAPTVVFHAAAHKHVPLMEENPEEAITNNILGTRNVVDVAIAHDVERLVMISTDKAAMPKSIMGASKRVSETVVRHAALKYKRPFVVVRFGNVLGSRGSVVPLFKQQIEQGGPVLVTHPEMRRYFMTIPEAVHLVLQAGGLGAGAELFVLDMGAPVRILDLAEDMIRLSGFVADEIPVVFTGLRPGERLEEVLWEAEATIEKTAHPKVLRVIEPDICAIGEVDDMVTSFARAASADRLTIDAEFARWIPSYVPASVSQLRSV